MRYKGSSIFCPFKRQKKEKKIKQKTKKKQQYIRKSLSFVSVMNAWPYIQIKGLWCLVKVSKQFKKHKELLAYYSTQYN